jgi:hypothetical protein
MKCAGPENQEPGQHDQRQCSPFSGEIKVHALKATHLPITDGIFDDLKRHQRENFDESTVCLKMSWSG